MTIEEYKKESEKKVPCSLCGQATDYSGVTMCYRCWELNRRVRSNPLLTEKILNSISKELGDTIGKELSGE